ncbi:MAG: hypothetical protein OEU36_22415 [Gammaproteobacteria bacterium]|nr:hypothetical protein [Gammaproteobacteria bacterium]
MLAQIQRAEKTSFEHDTDDLAFAHRHLLPSLRLRAWLQNTTREDMTMNPYDPHTSPDPQEWNNLDEGERIMLIEEYHRDAGIELPSVENERYPGPTAYATT